MQQKTETSKTNSKRHRARHESACAQHISDAVYCRRLMAGGQNPDAAVAGGQRIRRNVGDIRVTLVLINVRTSRSACRRLAADCIPLGPVYMCGDTDAASAAKSRRVWTLIYDAASTATRSSPVRRLARCSNVRTASGAPDAIRCQFGRKSKPLADIVAVSQPVGRSVGRMRRRCNRVRMS